MNILLPGQPHSLFVSISVYMRSVIHSEDRQELQALHSTMGGKGCRNNASSNSDLNPSLSYRSVYSENEGELLEGSKGKILFLN